MNEIEEINAEIRKCFLRIIELKDERRILKQKLEEDENNE
jgi:hypothetical protein